MKIRKPQSILLAMMFLLAIGCNSKWIESKYEMSLGYSTSTHSYVSSIDNKILLFSLGEEFINQQPPWSPGKPLTIPVIEICAIAKSELAKYTTSPSLWHIQSISIDCINYSPNKTEKWIYIVSFRYRGEHPYVNLPIGFNLEPIPGVFQK
jgi:hypothetical protein